MFIIFFFADSKWEDRWVSSTFKGSQQGKFKWTAGKFYGDAEKDKGLSPLQITVPCKFTITKQPNE